MPLEIPFIDVDGVQDIAAAHTETTGLERHEGGGAFLWRRQTSCLFVLSLSHFLTTHCIDGERSSPSC